MGGRISVLIESRSKVVDNKRARKGRTGDGWNLEKNGPHLILHGLQPLRCAAGPMPKGCGHVSMLRYTVCSDCAQLGIGVCGSAV